MVRLEVCERRGQHEVMVPCATWTPGNELLSCGDDGIIIKWGIDGSIVSKNTIDSSVTSISWMPSVGKGQTDVFAISCTDGTIRLVVGSTGREERKVQAHHGAAIQVGWNMDGSAMYSGGEDGEIKVWSKTANLRNTPVRSQHAVYAFAPGPGGGKGEELCYASERRLHVVSVGSSMDKNDTNCNWLAHEATVLCVDWNLVNEFVVSGGEDCRYKVWDRFGRQFYQSQPYLYVITSVAWSPNGSYFAVGAFNMLRLCEKSGCARGREHTQSGSIMHISWTADGTQLVGAGGNGTVLSAQLVERTLEWGTLEATLSGPHQIIIRDLSSQGTDRTCAEERLDFNRDRVVEMALGYDHLVVATSSQCYIYSTQNFTTPYIFDSPDTVSLVVLGETHFLVLSPQSGLAVYSYEGRKLSQPRYPGLRAEFLSALSVALSPDVLAVVDVVNRRRVHLFDIATGRPLSIASSSSTTTTGKGQQRSAPGNNTGYVEHKGDIAQIALNQISTGDGCFERQLMVIDASNEMHIYRIGNSKRSNGSYKLATQVDTAAWNDSSDMLAAVADGRLVVWTYPQIAWTDRDLLVQSQHIKEVATEFGKLSTIVSFRGSRVVVRRADGALVTTNISPYPGLLFEYTSRARWEEALKLCRWSQETQCWAALAGMAVNASNLDAAEAAFAALNHSDKYEYLQYVKNKVFSDEAKKAEMALFKRQPEEAERIFLDAKPPLLYRAIKMNIKLFRWERALELAVKHKSHIDTVLAYRSKYLERFDKQESDPRFNQLSSTVSWDWDQVKAKKDLEKQEEAERAGVPYNPSSSSHK